MDSRLAQRIDFEARRKTVSAILSELTVKTGVRLYSGYNNNDWQVHDRKMNIFAKDITLAALMNSIARVMNFKWTKNKNADPITYRLIMDRTMLLRQDTAQRKKDRNLASMFNGISAAAKCSPAELAQLRGQNPYLYALASTGTAAALNDLFNAFPAAKDAITEGYQLQIGFLDTPTSKRHILLDLMRGVSGMSALQKRNTGISPDAISADGSVGLIINLSPSQLGSIYMDYGDDSLDRVVSDGLYLSTPTDKHIVNRWRTALNDYYGVADTGSTTASDRQSNDEEETLPSKSTDAVLRQDMTEPLLEKKATLRINKTMRHSYLSLADYQSALAEAMGVSVVSDDFGIRGDSLGFAGGEIALEAFLKNYCWSFQYDWGLQDGIIELRDKNWFDKRSLQIPEAKLEKLRKAAIKNHKLSMDDLAGIGLVSQKQYEMNLEEDAILDCPDLEFVLSRQFEWLEFYLLLSDDQRAALFSDGIKFSDLNERQRIAISIYMMKRRCKEMSEDTCKLIFARTIAYGPHGVIIEKPKAGVQAKDAFTLCGYFDGLDEWMPIARANVPEYPDKQAK